jgi:hypothetical protein
MGQLQIGGKTKSAFEKLSSGFSVLRFSCKKLTHSICFAFEMTGILPVGYQLSSTV